MVTAEQQLTSKVFDCTSVDEQAALLTELAELKLSAVSWSEASLGQLLARFCPRSLVSLVFTGCVDAPLSSMIA